MATGSGDMEQKVFMKIDDIIDETIDNIDELRLYFKRESKSVVKVCIILFLHDNKTDCKIVYHLL